MRKPIFIVLILIVALIAGCSKINVTDEMVESVNIAALQKYSWVSVTDDAEQVRVANPEVEKIVVAVVDRYLARKGLEKATKEEADILFNWFGKVDDKVAHQSVSHFYQPYGYGPVASKHPVMVEEGAVKRSWQEGTLIIDIIDAKSKNVIWRGSASDTIRENMTEADAAAYIDRSAKTLLDRFFSYK